MKKIMCIILCLFFFATTACSSSNTKAVKTVETMIGRIRSYTYTKEIKEAKTTYEKLSPNLKKSVSNYERLEALVEDNEIFEIDKEASERVLTITLNTFDGKIPASYTQKDHFETIYYDSLTGDFLYADIDIKYEQPTGKTTTVSAVLKYIDGYWDIEGSLLYYYELESKKENGEVIQVFELYSDYDYDKDLIE